MLTVHHLSKSFDIHFLFENVTFSLNAGERMGLVGPNGCGKTTLLRILAGQESPDEGHIRHAANLRIGYLAQGFELPPHLSFSEVIAQAEGRAEALDDELACVAAALVANPSDAALQTRYDELLRRIELAESGHVQAILAGLGLAGVDADLPVGRLSGGQQTRLALALVLLDDPQLLLLDEPTNHLDIAMLEWLENWLNASPCAVLLVSHDRTFLDRTVTRILEMDPVLRRVREYAGNYSAYLAQRRAEIDKQWAEYKDQQQAVRQMQQDIARVKAQAAYTERQASSIRIGGPEMKIKGFKSYQQGIAKKVAKKASARSRKLERYLESDERVERPLREREIALEFGETAHLSHWALRTERLSVGYAPHAPLLRDLSLDIRAGRRIALTGPNGSGKTTLLRTLAGSIPPLEGEFHLGTSVRLGYLTQDQSSLPPGQNAVQTLAHAFPNETVLRNFLARFLFTGDEPLKSNSLYSYGQRARLMLALLVADGCNFLLLDEPVNHLDIPSRAQFEQALAEFDGAVLAVVHDRYFIERFADEIWWAENGNLRREFVR